MSQTRAKGVYDYIWLGGKGDLLGIMQENEIWPYYQMVYAENLSWTIRRIEFFVMLKYQHVT